MCRLIGVHSLSPVDAYTTVLQRIITMQLLYNAALEEQRDGAGVTDGVRLSKTDETPVGLDWSVMQMFDPNAPWLGHVRAASRGTDTTVYEAHPYRYGVDDTLTHFAHNGFFPEYRSRYAVPEDFADEHEPDYVVPLTDSYFAGNILHKLLLLTPDDPGHAIREWAALHSYRAEWSIAFHFRSRLHFVRGHRDLFTTCLNVNGKDFAVVCTSERAIFATRNALAGMLGEARVSLPKNWSQSKSDRGMRVLKSGEMLTMSPGGGVAFEEVMSIKPVRRAKLRIGSIVEG